ncbi:guanine nucleotide binding protein, alpha subunit [Gautieria morchelliformis]|nr:guanine nucleotide binding protein, alpha subunit [Gautieria morchelliformis]
MPRVRGRSNASFSTSLNDPDDPISRALQPPPDESPSERDERLRAEREAKRVNDEIDDELRRERAALRRKRPVRVLLLGQSESGKSTTLKNFQIHYAPQSWREERACWRAVIQLNLIRSVSLVLDTVAAAPPASSSPNAAHSSDLDPAVLVERYANLLARLAVAERILQRRLSPSDNEEPGDYRSFAASDTSPPIRASTSTTDTRPATPSLPAESPTPIRPSRQEFFVRTSGASWKTRLLRRISASSPQPPPSNHTASSTSSAPISHSAEPSLRVSIDFRGRDATPLQASPDEEPSSPTQLLYAASSEMIALWSDLDIRAALNRTADGVSTASGGGGLVSAEGGAIRVQDTPGFFLQDVDRIASRGYEPSDDDVIRARLRTMGVQEHRFTFERGVDSGREWRIYDVGGARSQRTSWFSFFDDMDAIIFLAPISCFDETLVEDRRVNRLTTHAATRCILRADVRLPRQEDSISLWRTLCRSPLLSRVQLVLFLNKVDLLRRKIANGARVARHVTSFGNRRNDAETVCKYFKQKFKEIQRQYSPEPRPYYVYFTSVTDTKATGVTLGVVREGILRSNLQRADFL